MKSHSFKIIREIDVSRYYTYCSSTPVDYCSSRQLGARAEDTYLLTPPAILLDVSTSILYVDAQSADTATLMVTTNSGHSVALFDNPFIKPVLEDAGLSPATAFGCIVNYLLVPRPEIFADLGPQLRAINDHQGLKIGIQIRVGDALMNGNVTLHDFDAFFACAGNMGGLLRTKIKG